MEELFQVGPTCRQTAHDGSAGAGLAHPRNRRHGTTLWELSCAPRYPASGPDGPPAMTSPRLWSSTTRCGVTRKTPSSSQPSRANGSPKCSTAIRSASRKVSIMCSLGSDRAATVGRATPLLCVQMCVQTADHCLSRVVMREPTGSGESQHSTTPRHAMSPRVSAGRSLGVKGFTPLWSARTTKNPCHGLWRSLVAHLTGGQGVAGSNPVSPRCCVLWSARRSGSRSGILMLRLVAP